MTKKRRQVPTQSDRVVLKPHNKTFYFPDPDRIVPRTQFNRSGKKVGVAFSAKDPTQLAAYAVAAKMENDDLRRFLGIDTYGQLLERAKAEGVKESVYIRNRLAQLRGVIDDRLRAKALEATHRRMGLGTSLPETFSSTPTSLTAALQQAEWLLGQYAKGAKRILDPFAGAGSIPIVASQSGRDAFYCSSDPVGRALAGATVEFLSWTDSARRIVLSKLREEKAKFRTRVSGQQADPTLAAAFDSAAVETSEESREFAFKCGAYVNALRGAASLHERLVARFMEAVIAGALGRVLRGEAPELTQSEGRDGIYQIRAAVTQHLGWLIGHLDDLASARTQPRYLTEDPADLSVLQPLSIDCVMTTVPRFGQDARSEAVERWFLRLPPKPDDLSAELNEKRLMLVAGGPDRMEAFLAIDGLQQVLDDVSEKGGKAGSMALKSYFVRLGRIMNAVNAHLTPKATLILDITDSLVHGARLETDLLLANLMKVYGFEQDGGLAIGDLGPSDARVTRRIVVLRRTRPSRQKTKGRNDR